MVTYLNHIQAELDPILPKRFMVVPRNQGEIRVPLPMRLGAAELVKEAPPPKVSYAVAIFVPDRPLDPAGHRWRYRFEGIETNG